MIKECLKSPNNFNSVSYFCKSINCEFYKNCFLAFNKLFKGMRELRIDFNKCNLNCRLCWSNNNDVSQEISVNDIINQITHCLNQNSKYIFNKNVIKRDLFKIQSFQIIGGV